MKAIISMTILAAAFTLAQTQSLTFVKAPSFTKDAQSRWWVEFETNQLTDVAISIVNPADSSVVRHLAAGVLNGSAPAPLAAGNLHQRIEWDGRDDAGQIAANPQSLTVRVRAGMRVKMANLVGENVYAFNSSFGGIVTGQNNSLYIFGSAGQGNARSYFLRQYDPAGNYLRTVYPPSTALSAAEVQGYGVNTLAGGAWSPKTSAIYNPMITNSFLTSSNTQLLPIGQPGELVLVNGTDMQVLSEAGALTSGTSRKIISSPAGPGSGYMLCGPRYFAASHNAQYLYLSGYYYGTVDMGTWLTDALVSGFWADGQVFRVNRATGVVSPWLKIDSVPAPKAERLAKLGGGGNATAAVHGVAIDDSLHVYVCDRLHRRIGVYDTAGVLLGSVSVANPDYVTVSRRTGAIYVITRTDASMNLLKFSGWRNPGPAAASTPLTTSINTHAGAPTLALSENGNTTIVWAGYSRFGVREYQDNGAAFSLVRDFSQGIGNLIYDRIAVDRKTQTTYINDAGAGLWKIENWSNPLLARCSTSARQPLFAGDVAVAPSGLLYVRTDNTFNGPIVRYTQNHLHAPVPYANTGTHNVTGPLYGRMGIGYGDKGFAISQQGKLGAIYMAGWNDYTFDVFPDTGSSATSGAATVTSLGKCGGVKYDRAGNVYLGIFVSNSSGRVVPSGFESDWGFGMSGAVVKYAAGTGGSVSGGTPAGAAKVYTQPLGAFSGDGGSACVCRSPRFDVDPYGRIFTPSGPTGQIYIADNAGNSILNFGQYGNTDSRGGLSGPGQIVTSPAIPLAWPIAVAASEDYVYVNDWVNARLVRVQMTYALDNLPNLTAPSSVAALGPAPKAVLAMSAAPNPFRGLSLVRVALPEASNLRLDVYDAAGRLIKTIASGRFSQGVHPFIWNGTHRDGRRVTGGLYVYRLTAGNKSLAVKTVVAK